MKMHSFVRENVPRGVIKKQSGQAVQVRDLFLKKIPKLFNLTAVFKLSVYLGGSVPEYMFINDPHPLHSITRQADSSEPIDD